MQQKMTSKLTPLLAALLLVLVGFALGSIASGDGALTAQQQIPSASSEIELHLADIYDRVSPSVVAITVSHTVTITNGESEEEFDDESFSSGTGFVVDRRGHIVTNFHVVEDSEEIIVNFIDGTLTRAEVIGLDPDADIAVIKVDLPEDRLFPVSFGRMNEVFVGQSVVAIGSPFGNNWTLTGGIVSALDRTIPSLSAYSIGSAIQTDAPINPGNSGGPLLNLRGQVIGVNAQINSTTRSNSGVGFAIPVDLVQRAMKELIENGEVAYSVIGIVGGDISLQVMEDLGLPNNQRGLIVREAIPGSPAAAAGLHNWELSDDGEHIISADIITAINGTPINGIGAVLTYLARFTRPGDVIDLNVVRDGQEIVVPLTLGQR
jgi:S1-C subfamily serine protease